MTNNSYRVGFWAILTIVALRLVIGWHFLTAGLEKLEPDFSSAGFLRSANGPLADFYKSMAPLPHDWDRLISEHLPPDYDFLDDRRYIGTEGELENTPTKTDRVGHIPFPTEAYGPWASRIAENWSETVARFNAIPGITDEQREAADAILQDKLTRLAQYFEEHRGQLADYHHEFGRLEEMLESDARGELPYLDERILKKKAEVQAMPRPWVADVEAEEILMHQGLVGLVTEEQRESPLLETQVPQAISPPTILSTVNTAVMLTTLIVGVCLILGLFTRLAALVGAGFLLSVMSTQPPWAEGVLETVKLLFAYQGIELVALLFLAAIGAGAWAGLDGLIWHSRED